MQANISESRNPRIVIVGGGFGGLQLAQKLVRHDVQIVLIDRNNYHTFIPLLYQVATAGLDASSVAYPIRKIFERNANFHFVRASVESVDEANDQVITDVGPVKYDHLVLATGSATNYFGNEEFARFAKPLKSVPNALDLRSYLLENLEESTLMEGDEVRRPFLNVVIVGGGPTGVEMAGAIGELRNKVLPTDYPGVDFSQMNVTLCDMQSRLLPGLSEEASAKAKAYLEQDFNVHVKLNVAVRHYDGEHVTFSDGSTMDSVTVIWAAGVKGDLPEGFAKEEVSKGNRVLVDPYNRVIGYSNVWAIGDVAEMELPDYPNGHPQVAPVAIQQGKHLAKNFIHKMKGEKLKPFEYYDKGNMATVGRNRAVADLPFNIKFQGLIAWLMWLGVHLMFLVGFRNRVLVLMDWVINYFSYDRAVRLIVHPAKREPNQRSPVRRRAEEKYV
mgnify:CR=1 FL=1